MAVDLTQRLGAVNDTDKPKKPSRVEKITAALNEIEQSGSFPDCVTETPGAFLWEFYKAWVENGGLDGGKNRNSIRRMRDHWLTGDSEVKSLHPKLTGRIRISKDDAKNLMTLFLGRWKFVGVKEGDWVLTVDGYAPFRCQDCKKLCQRLADAMYPAGSEQVGLGLLLPVRPDEVSVRELENEWSEVARLYLSSDATINLSRHQTAVGITPVQSMKNFWEVLKYLFDESIDKDVFFIWIVDIGSRQVEDEESWAEFFNFEVLKSQFRAFATFDSVDDDYDEDVSTKGPLKLRSAIHNAFLRHLKIPKDDFKEKRWKWLCERTCFAVQNLRVEEFQGLYIDEDEESKSLRLKDIGVTAEHILPRAWPILWGRQKEIQELYGRDTGSMADATVTVFLKSPAQEDQGEQSAPKPLTRYFAHTAFREHGGPVVRRGISSVISKEIKSPGELYDEAFGIVFWAAKHRLGRIDPNDRAAMETGAIALAYLRNLRMQMLRLPEFLKIHQTPNG